MADKDIVRTNHKARFDYYTVRVSCQKPIVACEKARTWAVKEFGVSPLTVQADAEKQHDYYIVTLTVQKEQ